MVDLASTSAGGSTVTFGMTPARRAGDIVLVTSAPASGDITAIPSTGTTSENITSAGVSTVSINTGVRYSSQASPAGVAVPTISLGVGVKYGAGIFTSAGQAATGLFVLTRIAGTDYFTIYTSDPPYGTTDVLLASKDGPGQQQSMFATSTGVASVSMTLGQTIQFRTSPAGVASLTNRLGVIYNVASTSAGRATMVNYLASPVRLTTTSNGVAGCTQNRLGGTARISATSAGVGHLTAYLGSPFHASATSAGVGHMTNYLSAPQRLTLTSAGRASVTSNYVSSRIYATATSAGKATSTQYLSTPVRCSSTAAGKGGGILYIGSRVYLAGTSSGRSANTAYESGTFLLPNTFMRGVGHMNLGPVFLNGYANGVGHVSDLYTAGTQRISGTAHGVGAMHDNTIFLRTTSNGSAAGTQMDKPPFALVCNAGARYYSLPAYYNADYSVPGGVFAYLSSPVLLANNNPLYHHLTPAGFSQPGTSRMDGISTFSFPYEPKSVCNAGCRAYDTYAADHDPTGIRYPVGTGPSDATRTPGGVFATQTGPVYMQAVANEQARRWFSDGVPVAYAYLSSQVYDVATSNGRSTVTFLRFGEFEADGIGGGTIILGAPQRMTATTHGVGGWPDNYLPDRRQIVIHPAGIGHMTAYEVGTVHFDAGIFTSHGVGTMDLSPTLFVTSINGRATVTIERPGNVYLSWGRDGYYWVDPDNFPVSDPILMPRGSNGIAHCEIEIDHVPILRNSIHGVATTALVPDGITRSLYYTQANAGSKIHYTPTGHYRDSLGNPFDYGVTITAFQSHDWEADGIATMMANQSMAYFLSWQKAGDGEYVLRVGGPTKVGVAGAEGHLLLAGPRQAQGVAHGISTLTNHMVGIFLMPTRIHGIAVVTVGQEGGITIYGDLLAQLFSIHRPVYGQIWPRRIVFGRPV